MSPRSQGIARFKDLCLDTSRAHDQSLARFWAAATGCDFEGGDGPGGDGPGGVVGDAEGKRIWICPVPEAKTVKHRVHLDLHVASVQELVDLGATVVEEQERWTVMRDPEGGELCAFVREQSPRYRVYELAVDASEAEPIARWWAEVFGREARNDGEPWWSVDQVPGMPFEAMVFGPVPEPKTVKNRMHWDLYGDPADLIARGATYLWDIPGRTRPIGWTVLADPEGNEFCVFPPGE